MAASSSIALGPQSTAADVIAKFGADLSGKNIVVTGASSGIGAEAAPSPELLARWNAFLPTGLTELKEVFLYRDLVIDGWAYQERGVGDFGTNDKLRAAVSLGGLAARRAVTTNTEVTWSTSSG